MKMSKFHPLPDEEDGLRLFALSRIPRCATCPRLAALEANHGDGAARAVPSAPRSCTDEYCAPLVKRYGARSSLAPTESRVSRAPMTQAQEAYSSRPQASTAKTL
jgi:hypothetical protein